MSSSAGWPMSAPLKATNSPPTKDSANSLPSSIANNTTNTKNNTMTNPTAGQRSKTMKVESFDVITTPMGLGPTKTAVTVANFYPVRASSASAANAAATTSRMGALALMRQHNQRMNATLNNSYSHPASSGGGLPTVVGNSQNTIVLSPLRLTHSAGASYAGEGLFTNNPLPTAVDGTRGGGGNSRYAAYTAAASAHVLVAGEPVRNDRVVEMKDGNVFRYHHSPHHRDQGASELDEVEDNRRRRAIANAVTEAEEARQGAQLRAGGGVGSAVTGGGGTRRDSNGGAGGILTAYSLQEYERAQSGGNNGATNNTNNKNVMKMAQHPNDTLSGIQLPHDLNRNESFKSSSSDPAETLLAVAAVPPHHHRVPLPMATMMGATPSTLIGQRSSVACRTPSVAQQQSQSSVFAQQQQQSSTAADSRPVSRGVELFTEAYERISSAPRKSTDVLLSTTTPSSTPTWAKRSPRKRSLPAVGLVLDDDDKQVSSVEASDNESEEHEEKAEGPTNAAPNANANAKAGRNSKDIQTSQADVKRQSTSSVETPLGTTSADNPSAAAGSATKSERTATTTSEDILPELQRLRSLRQLARKDSAASSFVRKASATGGVGGSFVKTSSPQVKPAQHPNSSSGGGGGGTRDGDGSGGDGDHVPLKRVGSRGVTSLLLNQYNAFIPDSLFSARGSSAGSPSSASAPSPSSTTTKTDDIAGDGSENTTTTTATNLLLARQQQYALDRQTLAKYVKAFEEEAAAEEELPDRFWSRAEKHKATRDKLYEETQQTIRDRIEYDAVLKSLDSRRSGSLMSSRLPMKMIAEAASLSSVDNRVSSRAGAASGTLSGRVGGGGGGQGGNSPSAGAVTPTRGVNETPTTTAVAVPPTSLHASDFTIVTRDANNELRPMPKLPADFKVCAEDYDDQTHHRLWKHADKSNVALPGTEEEFGYAGMKHKTLEDVIPPATMTSDATLVAIGGDEGEKRAANGVGGLGEATSLSASNTSQGDQLIVVVASPSSSMNAQLVSSPTRVPSTVLANPFSATEDGTANVLPAYIRDTEMIMGLGAAKITQMEREAERKRLEQEMQQRKEGGATKRQQVADSSSSAFKLKQPPSSSSALHREGSITSSSAASSSAVNSMTNSLIASRTASRRNVAGKAMRGTSATNEPKSIHFRPSSGDLLTRQYQLRAIAKATVRAEELHQNDLVEAERKAVGGKQSPPSSAANSVGSTPQSRGRRAEGSIFIPSGEHLGLPPAGPSGRRLSAQGQVRFHGDAAVSPTCGIVDFDHHDHQTPPQLFLEQHQQQHPSPIAHTAEEHANTTTGTTASVKARGAGVSAVGPSYDDSASSSTLFASASQAALSRSNEQVQAMHRRLKRAVETEGHHLHVVRRHLEEEEAESVGGGGGDGTGTDASNFTNPTTGRKTNASALSAKRSAKQVIIGGEESKPSPAEDSSRLTSAARRKRMMLAAEEDAPISSDSVHVWNFEAERIKMESRAEARRNVSRGGGGGGGDGGLGKGGSAYGTSTGSPFLTVTNGGDQTGSRSNSYCSGGEWQDDYGDEWTDASKVLKGVTDTTTPTGFIINSASDFPQGAGENDGNHYLLPSRSTNNYHNYMGNLNYYQYSQWLKEKQASEPQRASQALREKIERLERSMKTEVPNITIKFYNVGGGLGDSMDGSQSASQSARNQNNSPRDPFTTHHNMRGAASRRFNKSNSGNSGNSGIGGSQSREASQNSPDANSINLDGSVDRNGSSASAARVGPEACSVIWYRGGRSGNKSLASELAITSARSENQQTVLEDLIATREYPVLSFEPRKRNTSELETYMPPQELHLYQMYCSNTNLVMMIRPISSAAPSMYAGNFFVPPKYCDEDGIPLPVHEIKEDLDFDQVMGFTTSACRIKGKGIGVSLKSSPYPPIEGFIPINPSLSKTYSEARRKERQLEDNLMRQTDEKKRGIEDHIKNASDKISMNLLAKIRAQHSMFGAATSVAMKDIAKSLETSKARLMAMVQEYNEASAFTVDKLSVSEKYIDKMNEAQFLGKTTATWRGMDLYYRELNGNELEVERNNDGIPVFYARRGDLLFTYDPHTNELRKGADAVVKYADVASVMRRVEILTHKSFIISDQSKRIIKDPGKAFVIGPDFDGFAYAHAMPRHFYDPNCSGSLGNSHVGKFRKKREKDDDGGDSTASDDVSGQSSAVSSPLSARSGGSNAMMNAILSLQVAVDNHHDSYLGLCEDRVNISNVPSMGLVTEKDKTHILEARALTQWKQNHGYECMNTVKTQEISEGSHVVVLPTMEVRCLHTFIDILRFYRECWLRGYPLVLNPNWKVVLCNQTKMPVPYGDETSLPIVDDCGMALVTHSISVEGKQYDVVKAEALRISKNLEEQIAAKKAQNPTGARVVARSTLGSSNVVMQLAVALAKKALAEKFYALRRWLLMPPCFILNRRILVSEKLFNKIALPPNTQDNEHGKGGAASSSANYGAGNSVGKGSLYGRDIQSLMQDNSLDMAESVFGGTDEGSFTDGQQTGNTYCLGDGTDSQSSSGFAAGANMKPMFLTVPISEAFEHYREANIRPLLAAFDEACNDFDACYGSDNYEFTKMLRSFVEFQVDGDYTGGAAAAVLQGNGEALGEILKPEKIMVRCEHVASSANPQPSVSSPHQQQQFHSGNRSNSAAPPNSAAFYAFYQQQQHLFAQGGGGGGGGAFSSTPPRQGTFMLTPPTEKLGVNVVTDIKSVGAGAASQPSNAAGGGGGSVESSPSNSAGFSSRGPSRSPSRTGSVYNNGGGGGGSSSAGGFFSSIQGLLQRNSSSNGFEASALSSKTNPPNLAATVNSLNASSGKAQPFRSGPLATIGGSSNSLIGAAESGVFSQHSSSHNLTMLGSTTNGGAGGMPVVTRSRRSSMSGPPLPPPISYLSVPMGAAAGGEQFEGHRPDALKKGGATHGLPLASRSPSPSPRPM